MGPKTERLIAALGEVVSMLEKQGDSYHANQVLKCKILLENSDFRGIGHALSVFNPKHSLNEVDWPVDDDDRNRISLADRFQILSSTIYGLADEIRREVERDLRK